MRLIPRRRDVAAAVMVLCSVTTAAALPDLTPEIYSVQIQTGQSVPAGDVADGCAASTDGRTLVRFGVRTWNLGPDTLNIGDPGCPDCTVSAPGTSCTNPEFQCSVSGVPRVVFLSSARYELLDFAGNVLAVGAKRNYCFNDDGCNPPATPAFTNCANEGITAGCWDDYEPYLSCQYIDATDVPDVTTRALRIRVTIDPEHLLPDADRSDDVSEVVVPGCGDGIVQPGEECDAGTAGAPCCDSTCHFVAAGTVCRPSAAPCDIAATCDGSSPICPPAATTPGCVVDGTCIAPGTIDPANSCELCDPERQPNGWSPDVASDPVGMGCQLAAIIAAGLPGCPGRFDRLLRKSVQRAQHVLARFSSTGGTARLEARLLRIGTQLTQVLGRAARRPGCDPSTVAAEAQVLLGQIRTFTTQSIAMPPPMLTETPHM